MSDEQKLSLYFIRHCLPADQEAGYSGEPNPPLGIVGQEQAKHVAEQIASWGVDELVSSSMRRALQTAEPIYARLGIDWHVWPALSETSRRSWPALRLAGTCNAFDYSAISERERAGYPSIADTHPHARLSQPFEPVDRWVYHDETREQSYDRGRRILKALIGRQPAGKHRKVAIVGHAALGSVLLSLLSGAPPCDHNRFHFAHGAIARADIIRDSEAGCREAAICFSNYVQHLPTEWITEGYNY